MSAAQRKKFATDAILQAVGGTASTKKDLALTAALELFNEQMALEPGFRVSLQEKYKELLALGGAQQAAKPPMPQPIRTPGEGRTSPLRKADPYEWAKDYGHDHLRAALAYATQTSLKEAVDMVLAREPGATAPKRNNNQSMIDFLVEHVAGPGY